MAVNDAQIWKFHGGLHLPDHNELSTRFAITKASLPEKISLPLQQHIGEPAEPIVKIGDYVLKGQQIARANGYISVPVHASSSGTVIDISNQPIPHPSGMSSGCIDIETDGKDEWIQLPEKIPNYRELDPSALRNIIRDAGIVGLGGAGFPSFIKLNPGTSKTIDTLILNGAECEPYISCDDILMRERAAEIIEGLKIMQYALQAKRCIIGIEDNKPQAYAALNAALEEIRKTETCHASIVKIPTIYPAGGEKQLVEVLTGKEVPSHGLPIDIGIVCHNVATAASIYHAVIHAKPLISRIVTITGQGVKEPQNMEVLVGTYIDELIEQCGGYTDQARRLIVGGPMMGFTLHNDHVPITKTTNCILATDVDGAQKHKPAMPCIRCGACAEVCPAILLPQQLYWYSHAKEFDKIQDYHLFDCIECGCCAYVCPSHIPLVQYYRYAKTEIWAQEREKQKSDHARNRHEFRLDRLEREKLERDERMRKKKAALEKNKGLNNEEDPKKAAIQAALERVKAKQNTTKPKNIDNLTEEQKQKIAEVEARRKRNAPDIKSNNDT